ncbi:hypothetical protein HYALB_00007274 [Hymenoscyphus albidus]|uniref:N-acetyltransferase domain-containing protein n=1 Tax=Hymenoscyphus albidus TaxID=595503 RepID=A0A9N9Q1L4_9HELO|nr:hypothetical protein HYALB_00007274 [Hymenoscyphus albidus]
MATSDSPKKAKSSAGAVWREMSVNDVEGLLRVADKVHPDLPESGSVFAERAKLFPRGCMVLVAGSDIVGYTISHPINYREPPKLDTLLEQISPSADQHYIHDLAILPAFRENGRAAECIQKLLAVAESFPTTCLVSVYGTAPFWGRFGFKSDSIDATLTEKLRGYGDDAEYLERKNGLL